MLYAARRYEFSTDGFNKMKLDNKKSKLNLGIDIMFWSIMISLYISGTITPHTLFKISACSITSRSVKWLVKKGKI